MEEEENKDKENNILLKYDFNKDRFHFTEDVQSKKKIISKTK